MFEPLETEEDELKIAVSLPELDAVSHSCFISLDNLNKSSLQRSDFDALFVSGILPDQSRNLSELCMEIGVELVIFENPLNNLAAIHDVVINITDKLFSSEMPNNIDLADIRNINQSSDYMFAFNDKQLALDFMKDQGLGDVIGGVYLAHGYTELEEYEATNKELLNYFSDDGFLCSSFHSSGRSKCTILLGIKKQGVR